MIKCRNCSNSSLSSAVQFNKQPLLPLLVLLAITGSFFVEVDSVMERERAGQAKVQLSRDEAQSLLLSVDPKSQPQLQQQQPQQQALPPTTMATKNDITNTYKINSNTNTETVKIGNSKTKNYNFQESNYLPTQLTQVVLNVPKTHSRVLRRTRPPTVDEFMIKRKILDVYDKAAGELSGALDGEEASLNGAAAALASSSAFASASASSGIKAVNGQQSLYFNQLGRILQALNPKYIATERVRDVAFADPTDPNGPVQLPDVPPQLLALELGGQTNEQTVEPVQQAANLLLELEDRFRSQVSWDQDFIAALSATTDQQLQPAQLAFKRLLLCLNDPIRCSSSSSSGSSSVNDSTMAEHLDSTDIGAISSNQEQQVAEENTNENDDFDDEVNQQRGFVYLPDNHGDQEPVVYDRQVIMPNSEPSYNENYNQYAYAENSPSLPTQPSHLPNVAEPLRFRFQQQLPPPSYGLQNKRAFNQFQPQVQTQAQSRFPNRWPTNESRPQPHRAGSPNSANNQNNNYRFDAFKNRYQFRAQPSPPPPPQRYVYQRQPPQKQSGFV